MKKILIILVIMLGSLETQVQKISLLYQGIYFGLPDATPNFLIIKCQILKYRKNYEVRIIQTENEG